MNEATKQAIIEFNEIMKFAAQSHKQELAKAAAEKSGWVDEEGFYVVRVMDVL